jgi:hypothetical protein
LRALIGAVRQCHGGPWVAGVALGIYSHGPAIGASGNAVPMDVNRLRILDPRYCTMIENVEAHIGPTGIVAIDVAADTIIEEVTNYRSGMASAAADALIADFDDVVIQIVFADAEQTNDGQAHVLAEADKLVEDAGMQEVADFLRERLEVGPLIRERYVDALEEIGATALIVEVAQFAGPADLSRRELEHAMFACGKEGRDDLAKQLWTRHCSEFDDSAAGVTRQELIRRFPGFRKLGK